MASAATDLTRDRVDFLRSALAARFAAHPTFRRAIISVLDPLSDGWAQHDQGMEGSSFDRLNAALVSPLEALLIVPPDQAQYTIDQLSIAWDKVRDHLAWVG